MMDGDALFTAKTMMYVKILFRWDRFAMIFDEDSTYRTVHSAIVAYLRERNNTITSAHGVNIDKSDSEVQDIFMQVRKYARGELPPRDYCNLLLFYNDGVHLLIYFSVMIIVSVGVNVCFSDNSVRAVAVHEEIHVGGTSTQHDLRRLRLHLHQQ